MVRLQEHQWITCERPVVDKPSLIAERVDEVDAIRWAGSGKGHGQLAVDAPVPSLAIETQRRFVERRQPHRGMTSWLRRGTTDRWTRILKGPAEQEQRDQRHKDDDDQPERASDSPAARTEGFVHRPTGLYCRRPTARSTTTPRPVRKDGNRHDGNEPKTEPRIEDAESYGHECNQHSRRPQRKRATSSCLPGSQFIRGGITNHERPLMRRLSVPCGTRAVNQHLTHTTGCASCPSGSRRTARMPRAAAGSRSVGSWAKGRRRSKATYPITRASHDAAGASWVEPPARWASARSCSGWPRTGTCWRAATSASRRCGGRAPSVTGVASRPPWSRPTCARCRSATARSRSSSAPTTPCRTCSPARRSCGRSARCAGWPPPAASSW